MWWNFVARTREEISAAARQWRAHDPRFGRVDSPLARLRLPPLPWRSP
jgi:quercetin 2,3-dioxygenase